MSAATPDAVGPDSHSFAAHTDGEPVMLYAAFECVADDGQHMHFAAFVLAITRIHKTDVKYLRSEEVTTHPA